MQASDAGIHRTLEYSQSHSRAREVLPYSMVGIVLGLFLLTPLDGASLRRENAWLGGGVVLLSSLFVLAAIYRRSQRSVPSIVLSPAGVLFQDLSAKPIPWDEILGVGTAHVRNTGDLFSTKVTKLELSQSSYTSLTGGSWQMWTIARNGDPSEVYLSYYHNLPFDEFQREVRLRWRAFSRNAVDKSASATRDEDGRAVPAANSSGKERGSTGAETREAATSGAREAIAALLRGSSATQLLVISLSCAGIAVLLANHVGLWSTARQVTARAEAARWHARQQQYDADRKATDAEQRRIEEMWKKHKW